MMNQGRFLLFLSLMNILTIFLAFRSSFDIYLENKMHVFIDLQRPTASYITYIHTVTIDNYEQILEDGDIKDGQI